jgi:ribosomal protein S18 acetylase RimI-like enzyme
MDRSTGGILDGEVPASGYPAGWDMVVVDPAGRLAAFCIGWLDCENADGYLEPVGTHPEFQRQGLGRTLLADCVVCRLLVWVLCECVRNPIIYQP